MPSHFSRFSDFAYSNPNELTDDQVDLQLSDVTLPTGFLGRMLVESIPANIGETSFGVELPIGFASKWRSLQPGREYWVILSSQR